MIAPLVSIVIPTHNRRDKLLRLLETIQSIRYSALETIVVDDASSDGTEEEVRRRFPKVRVIRNDEKRLLAGSRNVGITNANGEFIFLIDDDNVVDDAVIIELVRAMNQDPSIGVAGPLMYYYSDPERIWCATVKRSWISSVTTFVGRNQTNDVVFGSWMESEDFPNAFMVRKRVFKEVGLFDEETFPIHYDEADFCQRVRKAGYAVMLIPTAKVWHDIPLPKRELSQRVFHLQSVTRAYYTARNRIVYHKRYSGGWRKVVFLTVFMPLITLYYLAKLILSGDRSTMTLGRAYLKGTIDGLRWRERERSH